MASEDLAPPSDAPDAQGWVFLPPEAVPASWKHRVIHLCLVPLLPNEAQSFLTGHEVDSQLSPQEVAIARLAARGRTLTEIADELDISERTVARRLNDLHRALGTDTKKDLARALAERGFGG